MKDKYQVLECLIKEIEFQLDTTKSAYEMSKNASIDAPGKMQSNHDTTKEEQGALANSLASRIYEIERGIYSLKGLKLVQNEKVAVGSLVKLKGNDSEKNYFLSTYGAGVKIEEVIVITPLAPISKVILNKNIGDKVNILSVDYEIIDVK